MKTILFIILLTLTSCVAQKELTQQDSEKVYQHSVQLTESEIKSKLLTFVNENFYSGKAVIQTNEEKLISGNYNFYCSNFDPLGSFQVYCDATFIVKYSDNNYRIKLVAKNLFTKSSSGIGILQPTFWGNYAGDINNNFSAFDKSLYDYMNAKDTF